MTNVIDLARHYVQPKKVSTTKGGEYHSPCPSCGGKDRFHIWPDQNQGAGSWWCRQCGKGGDNIQFLRDFEGLGYKEACDRLGVNPKDNPNAGVHAPPTHVKSPAPQWQPAPTTALPTDIWQKKAKTFATWAFENLMNMDPNDPTRQWLHGRGINEFVIKYFGLGWNPGKDGKDLFRPRESWGLPPEQKSNGQFKKLWIPKGLVIPMLAPDISIARIRIRREASDPRYYVLPGSNMDCLTESASNARAVVIVESELDAMMIFHHANIGSPITHVIALGNSSRKPDAEATKLLQSAAVILNALDYDNAGASGGTWWQRNFSHVIRWPAPVGKDPGEAYEQGADIREWIKNGLPKGWFL